MPSGGGLLGNEGQVLLAMVRGVDQSGYELEVLVQPHRSAKAALRFYRKLLNGLLYGLGLMITDKVRSYKAARKKWLETTEYWSHKRLNNRINNAWEFSHGSLPNFK